MSELTPKERKIVVVHQRVTKQVEVLDDLSAAKTELHDSIGYLKQAVRILRGSAREEAEAILDEVRDALDEFDAIHRELQSEVDVALDESEQGLPAGY